MAGGMLAVYGNTRKPEGLKEMPSNFQGISYNTIKHKLKIDPAVKPHKQN